jgi:hypothetical protein
MYELKLFVKYNTKTAHYTQIIKLSGIIKARKTGKRCKGNSLGNIYMTGRRDGVPE